MQDNQIYKAFIEWKARPITPTSDVQTHDDFCKKFKITTKKLIEFTDHPTYHDDLVSETLLWAKGKTPELIHTVYDQIKLSKSVTDLSKFMELVHGIKEKKDSTTNQQFNFFNTVNDKQFEDIIKREARLLKRSGKEEPLELLSGN